MSAETILPLSLAEVGYSAGDVRILHAISATFEAGPVSVILGANGAGKSVLLRLCHGLLTPTAGRIAWDGGFAGDPRRRQAMVFQRPVMLRRSALANVAYGLALAGRGRAERIELARRTLDRIGLLSLAERPARLLSGGEQQRLALARAWVLRPEVLFLDEPTANLDPSATRAVEIIIRDIAAEGNKVIMTTHDLGQAKRLADEILFLHRGRLIERADRATFFTQPATPEAGAFLRGDLPWD